MPSFTSFDGTKIEYRTQKNGDYLDLDDPESLQKVLDDDPWENVRIVNENMKRKEKEKQASASKRLRKRLEELKYDKIPDKEPGISLFRAKHKLQCFEARLDHVKQVMSNPKSERVSLSRDRRKAFRNNHLPKLGAVLKDLEDTHSRLADSPEKVELEHILRRFEILNEQYAVLGQKRDKQGKPLTSTHEHGSGSHSVAPEPRSGRHSPVAGPESGTCSVKPRSRTHSRTYHTSTHKHESTEHSTNLPDPHQPELEDSEFSALTQQIYHQHVRPGEESNWLEHYLR